MKSCKALILSLVAVLLVAPALAQSSSEPMRIVTPYAAGGTNDALARLVAKYLGERWGRPVIVDNRPGGAGMIAS